MSLQLSQIKNKNIAVGFFGISYMKSYKHWMGWETNPDWRKTNYKETLYNILLNSNNNIDHYLSTYHNDLENELLSYFNPINCKLNDFILNIFQNHYDYYIMTRFDLSFDYDVLSMCNIKNSAINVTSKHGYGTDTELLCDYFYIFDNSMLKPFTVFIENLPPDNGDLCYYHKLHRYENSPTFAYMIEGSYYSHNCPLWKITR